LALAEQLAADDAGRAAVEAGAGTADVIVDRVVNMATVEGDDFSVLLIPHSLAVTTWGALKIGDELNIEVDLMARYAERLSARA